MNKRHSNWYIPSDWLCILGMSIIPVCVGVVAGILLPLVARLHRTDVRVVYVSGLAAAVIGIAMLFVARLPLYKQRRFWTVGPFQLDQNHRRIYWLAYAFVASSLLLLGVVWLRAHEN